MQIDDENIKDILRRYDKRLESDSGEGLESFSLEFKKFKEAELGKKKNWYEKACEISEGIIAVKSGRDNEEALKNAIRAAGLNVTPTGANSFGVVAGAGLIFLAVFYLGAGFILDSMGIFSLGLGTLFICLFLILTGAVIIKPLGKLPVYFEQRWRLQTGNQMVICILYIVMYLRHTSNLEHALRFAAEHIGDPLAYDLKKVFWNIEAGKYSTIKESLDNYLRYWRDYNPDFVNSLNLIEASLYEPAEQRRIEMLDKALKVMLDGNYKNMLHYAHDLKGPMEALHMLGVILPILGLVILPLFASFIDMNYAAKVFGLFVVYNLMLPVFVYLKGMSLLSKRPSSQTGFMLDYENRFRSFREINFLGIGMSPMFFAVLIGFVFLFIGFLPVIMHIADPGYDFAITKGVSFFGYTEKEDGGWIGPNGIGALLISLMIPLGLAIATGFYYRARSRKLIKMRGDIERMENEFSGLLFQLGNKIGDGLPAEIAFSKVAEELKDTPSAGFFRMVVRNIKRMGMGIKEAVFNPSNGALLYYPSMLVMTSMKVLVETAKKGPKIAADSLMNISKYIEDLNSAGERLKDLLAEIVSSMKSQVNFLTPLIAGIVVGIGSMITSILGLFMGVGKISTEMGGEAAASEISGTIGTGAGITDIFNPANVIPPFYFQIIVGLYVLEIAFILTVLSNSIDTGGDKLSKEYALGRSLSKSTFLYVLVALIVIVIFNLLAFSVASKAAG